MLFLTVIICGLPAVMGQAHGEPYTVTPLDNSGILFEDLGALLIYHNTWNILTELDLSELENQTILAEHADHLVFRLCGNHTDVTELCETQQIHVHSIIENIKRRTAVIRELMPRPRKSRSIFDGIGNAMHYLFGTMDHNNEIEIYSRLEETGKNEQALIELEKQQISVVKNTLAQIQKPLASLVDRQRQIVYQINDLFNLTEELSQRQLRQEIISNLVLQVVEIEFRQQALLDIIIASRNNQIHPLLVSPNVLLQIYSKTHPKCFNPQKCLSTLYQTVEIRSHVFQEKLVIKANLPILNKPTFKLQQIRCFPIHTKENHSLVPDIEYSHVASQLQTQEFLLLKPENVKHFKKVTYNMEEHTFVGRLNTPVIKATTSHDCVIRLLFNPLNRTLHCNLRVQQPPRDVLIKLTRPNTWLFSLTSPQDVHLTCINQFTTARLSGPGTIAINQPCQVQVGSKILHFEEEDSYPLKISQPAYFPVPNGTLLERGWEHAINTPQLKHPNQLELLAGDSTNEIIHQGTQSLDEVKTKLSKLRNRILTQRTKTLSEISLSLTSLAFFGLAIYAVIKIYPRIAAKIHQSPQHTDQNVKTGERSDPTNNTPKPMQRAQTLPKPRSVQIV